MFFTTALVLVLTNSPWSGFYTSVWNNEIGIKTEHFELIPPLILWINDGLMVIFFFLIGLEIKWEVLIGELNSMKKASLPIFAAIGGILISLAIYLLLHNDPEATKG